MRLINTSTLELEWFVDCRSVKYAILSHTWGPPSEEVTLQDVMAPDRSKLKGNPGWEKIRRSSILAKNDGLRYIWVDTCCIDKTSSAELQEAINSMFLWYAEAVVCYAFLADMTPATRAGWPRPNEPDRPFEPSPWRSRWFSRGWTLQELIAPIKLIFYDRDWRLIGHLSSRHVGDGVSEATGIRRQFIDIFQPRTSISMRHVEYLQSQLALASVAERFSWAAARTTTRQEDAAYCLLGIFGISMPMLYGEGNAAFRRLQAKILKRTEDHSILAHGYRLPLYQCMSTASHDRWVEPGPDLLTAKQPQFKRCGTVQSFHRRSDMPVENSSVITQRGVQMELPILPDANYGDLSWGVLNCGDTRHGSAEALALPLLPATYFQGARRSPPGYCRLPGGPLRVDLGALPTGGELTPTPRTLISIDQMGPTGVNGLREANAGNGARSWGWFTNEAHDLRLVTVYPPQPLWPRLFDYGGHRGRDNVPSGPLTAAVFHFIYHADLDTFNLHNHKPATASEFPGFFLRLDATAVRGGVLTPETAVVASLLPLEGRRSEPSLAWLQDAWRSCGPGTAGWLTATEEVAIYTKHGLFVFDFELPRPLPGKAGRRVIRLTCEPEADRFTGIRMKVKHQP